jgi:flagellar motor switch protein FliM
MSNEPLSADQLEAGLGDLKDEQQQNEAAKRLDLYDFRRPDRVAKDQLRSIHGLHENFARSAASSLSAYLRTYVSSRLISVEQLSFSDVLAAISSPTCIVSLRMPPHQGGALLEMDNAIVFPIVEMLLGGAAKDSRKIERDTTEIERSILDGVLRLVLKDLSVAWQTMAEIEFFLEGYQRGPDLFRYLPLNEAMLAVRMEFTIGQYTGPVTISIPSIIVKMQRQKRAHQMKSRSGNRSDSDFERVFRLTQQAQIHADVRLNGSRILLRDLAELNVGDVLSLGYAVSRPLELNLNGARKFRGRIETIDTKRCFHILDLAETSW